jgi:hypothetical protein
MEVSDATDGVTIELGREECCVLIDSTYRRRRPTLFGTSDAAPRGS